MVLVKELTAKGERKMDDFKHIKVNVGYHGTENAVYRIYVDEDLITERTFGWPSFKNYIRENLICLLDPGIHTLTIENHTKLGYFELSDFTLNNDTSCLINTKEDESFTGRIITFRVYP